MLRIIPQFKKLTIISHNDLAKWLEIDRSRLFFEFDYTPGDDNRPSLARFHVLVDGAELKGEHKKRVESFLRKRLRISDYGEA